MSEEHAGSAPDIAGSFERGLRQRAAVPYRHLDGAAEECLRMAREIKRQRRCRESCRGGEHSDPSPSHPPQQRRDQQRRGAVSDVGMEAQSVDQAGERPEQAAAVTASGRATR